WSTERIRNQHKNQPQVEISMSNHSGSFPQNCSLAASTVIANSRRQVSQGFIDGASLPNGSSRMYICSASDIAYSGSEVTLLMIPPMSRKSSNVMASNAIRQVSLRCRHDRDGCLPSSSSMMNVDKKREARSRPFRMVSRSVYVDPMY